MYIYIYVYIYIYIYVCVCVCVCVYMCISGPSEGRRDLRSGGRGRGAVRRST